MWPSEVEKGEVEREAERTEGEVEVKFSTAHREGGAFGASAEC